MTEKLKKKRQQHLVGKVVEQNLFNDTTLLNPSDNNVFKNRKNVMQGASA